MVPRPPVTPDEFFALDLRIAGFTSEFLVLGAVDPDDGTVHLLELPDAVAPGWSVA